MYEDYNTEDFLADPYFRKWVLNPDDECKRFWSEWLQQNPDKAQTVREARGILRGLTDLTAEKSEDLLLDSTWQKIQKTLQARQDQTDEGVGKANRRAPVVMISRHQVATLAASFIGFLMLIGGILLNGLESGDREDNIFQVQTREKPDKYQLPDGSNAFLNSGSKLKYQVTDDGPREVWVEGEAFFNVKAKSTQGLGASNNNSYQHSRFKVHTDNLEIVVVGTKFNVLTKDDQSQVVLNEGKINIAVKGMDKQYQLMPGEYFAFKKGKIFRKKVNTDIYSAWKEGSTKFNKVPLKDMAEWIEDRYNKIVIIENPSLKHKTFTAEINTVKLPHLIEAFELIYQTKIKQKRDTILIK